MCHAEDFPNNLCLASKYLWERLAVLSDYRIALLPLWQKGLPAEKDNFISLILFFDRGQREETEGQ